jgi:alkylation response protein AidB-like acyl-CoA dehydrogenase
VKNLKMMIAMAGLVTLAPMVTASAAERPHYRHGIEARQRNQMRRIEQGERSGALTWRESERLERQQGRIERQEDRYRMSGGRFTPAERARIQRELNNESRRIYRQKHDGQYRWGWR